VHVRASARAANDSSRQEAHDKARQLTTAAADKRDYKRQKKMTHEAREAEAAHLPEVGTLDELDRLVGIVHVADGHVEAEVEEGGARLGVGALHAHKVAHDGRRDHHGARVRLLGGRHKDVGHVDAEEGGAVGIEGQSMLELDAVVARGEEEAYFRLVELHVDLGSALARMVHAAHLACQ